MLYPRNILIQFWNPEKVKQDWDTLTSQGISHNLFEQGPGGNYGQNYNREPSNHQDPFCYWPCMFKIFYVLCEGKFFFFNKLIDIISNGKAPGYNRYTKKVENLQLEGKYLPSYFS